MRDNFFSQNPILRSTPRKARQKNRTVVESLGEEEEDFNIENDNQQAQSENNEYAIRYRWEISGLETIQVFLIKLDIKPLMHLLEISIFSLNNDLVKIMNILVNNLQILSFKVIFKCLKLVKSFQKKFL